MNGAIHHASLVVCCWLWWLMIPNVASSAFWCWWWWMIMPIIPSAIWWLREGMPHIMPAVSCWFDDGWSAHHTYTLYLCVMILVMNDTATHTSASAQLWFWWWMIPHIIESESESEIVYSIDIHRIHLQIKLHNTITHTCKSVVIYGESTMSPKIEGRQPDSSVVTGDTPSCHKTTKGATCDNKGRQIGDRPPQRSWASSIVYIT